MLQNYRRFTFTTQRNYLERAEHVAVVWPSLITYLNMRSVMCAALLFAVFDVVSCIC